MRPLFIACIALAALLGPTLLAGLGLAATASPGSAILDTTTTPTSPRVNLPLVANPLPSTPTTTPTLEPSPTATAITIATATATPTATATTGSGEPLPTATPALPPPDFTSCAVVGNPGRAPNFPVRIVGIDKQAETVTLRNVSTGSIELTGWRMCSVTGGQQHPIGDFLAAGEQRTFPGPAANIWNNSSSDPGALWNAAGQLVSYWPD